MKYIKTFESKNKTPEVGDYVICSEIASTDTRETTDFIENNIGQIIQDDDDIYKIKYINPPLTGDFLHVSIDDPLRYRWAIRNRILHFSKNKEDLEAILAAEKFNL